MGTTTNSGHSRQRLYRIWMSYCISDNSRRELRCEVIAGEAARAIQTVLRKHAGIDVIVATIEQVASLDEALRAEDDSGPAAKE